jgi:hypothetical protein
VIATFVGRLCLVLVGIMWLGWALFLALGLSFGIAGWPALLLAALTYIVVPVVLYRGWRMLGSTTSHA